MEEAPRSEMIFDIVGLPGEYNYKPNRGAITKDTPPVISYDGKSWSHITDFEYDESEPHLRLRIRPKTATFRIAHTPPYTTRDLTQLRRELLNSPDARETIIGRSVEGRDLYLWTIARGSPAKTVWLMFRQHAWESGSSWAGEGAVRALLDTPALRGQIAWKILPMADPDGVVHGGVRFNRNGYDLNRNWDVKDPRRMPEIDAQRRAIVGRVDLFLTLHNTETSEYLEGPSGALAEQFFAALKDRSKFDPSRPLSAVTAESAKGRSNVAQTLIYEMHFPAFLMEQRIAFNPKLGRLPEVEDRVQFGRQLVETIASLLERADSP